jgi:hypothetical protein
MRIVAFGCLPAGTIAIDRGIANVFDVGRDAEAEDEHEQSRGRQCNGNWRTAYRSLTTRCRVERVAASKRTK